ncbi:Protein vip1 [Mycena sanguinolenta]|uniref:Protein vip1 n=1 Tax=Mycena sanguinolenta TaxID=230812 RepID=A0A8H6YEF4_9AGAR|nr:Protein vip1 [Mycena sanguinolenta]
MSTYSVHVSGISATTTQEHLHDFFTFCGKIVSIDFVREKSTATIHFEKSSAAKTALMLHGGTLDGSTLEVTSETEHEDEKHAGTEPVHSIDQSDKPRAGIAAEYLARGYTLSDHILNKAIDIDNKNGISHRFLSYMKHLDNTLGAKALGPDKTISGKAMETVGVVTEQARTIDEQRGISKTATDVRFPSVFLFPLPSALSFPFFPSFFPFAYFFSRAYTQLHSQYYTRAFSSPFGEKVRAFYTTTTKQVLDIHEEAKRISASHKAATASGTSGTPAPATTEAT